MYISEIFSSIQGEGRLTGLPSVFIRTSGCNLRCGWCDSRYTSWEPEGIEMTIDEIIGQVKSYPVNHIVLTGGEPMIAKGIFDLAEELHALQNHITIETSGTVAPNGIKCDLASISPKMTNSRPAKDLLGDQWEIYEKRRIQPEILDEWFGNYDYQAKFVISSEEDIIEVNDFIDQLKTDILPLNIYLMPEGTTVEELNKRSDIIIRLCNKYGYRYCDRLQIRLFGNLRGK